MTYLSVIIPVYNSSITILESINSVEAELADSMFKWEIILINDGSTDDSELLINNYINNSRFKKNIKLVSQENSGVAAARNTGLKIANGNFIAFNDSDDKWLKGKVSLQMNYLLKNDDIQMVAGVFGDDNLSSLPFKKIKNTTVITIHNQVLKNYFSPQTTIFRKKVLNKVGFFNDKMRYAEEGYFFNRMVYFYKCVVINEVVTIPITQKRRWGDSGLSGNLIKMEKGELFNITNAYKSQFISTGFFILAISLSLIKFIRRICLSEIHKNKF
jgi:glycosyltransferase involved in cell wall biosynthesis